MTQPLAKRMAAQRGKPCSNPRCTDTRWRLSKWCKRCNERQGRYGSPTGRKLTRRLDYQREHDLCTNFIKRHIDHAGIRSAVAFLDSLMPPELPQVSPVAAQQVPQVPAESAKVLKPHLLRLSDHGITAIDILIECSALWLMAQWRERELDDGIHLTKTMGTAVLHLAPRQRKDVWMNGIKQQRYKRHGMVSRSVVGETLRQVLGSLLLNISRTIIDRETERDTFGLSLSQPFSSNPVTAHHNQQRKVTL